MRDDPELIHAVIHSLNEWLLRAVDLQLRGPHLHHARDHAADRRQGDRGARVGASSGAPRPSSIRPAPVPGLPRLAVVRLRGVRPVLAGRRRRRHPRLHARLRQRLRPLPERLDRPAGDAAVQARPVPHDDHGKRADRGHDGGARPATALFTRFPDLRVASIENGGDWVVPFLHHLADTYRKMPHAFAEDPVEAFKRNVWISPFHEDDLGALIDVHGRRPHPVRVRLPAPRRPRRARAATSTTSPTVSPTSAVAEDHGRQPRPHHARRRR